MLSSNSVVLYDENGLAITVADGATAPASALAIGGSDGTNFQILSTDSTGRSVIVGAGVAGTGAGGVITVQGDAAGTALPISGSVSVTGSVTVAQGTAANLNATVVQGTAANLKAQVFGGAADGAAVTGNPVLIAGSDGTNVQTLLVDALGKLLVTASGSTSATGTLSNVAASATSVTVLASNAARLGATVVNDGNSKLYLKFGTTASTTSFTVLIPAQGYYEVPFGFTGRMDGLWTSANGSARVTEMT